MKRIFARLLSFALMTVMVISVTGKLSSNFPEVYRVIGVAASEREGDWVLYTNRTEDGRDSEIIRLKGAGKLLEGITEPKGFVLCLFVYLILLFVGRRKSNDHIQNNEYECDEEVAWQVDNPCA